MNRILSFAVFYILQINLLPVFAQNEKRQNQFDFWIGEWTVEWVDDNGNSHRGTNSITKILDGKVVEENFTTEFLRGKSLSVFDPEKKIWQQTWVDNNGAYMTFTGGMEKDKMILYRDTSGKETDPVKFRMIFYNIKENSLSWNWEKSVDNGKNWELKWKLNYKRKK